jgi:hypothetical protein
MLLEIKHTIREMLMETVITVTAATVTAIAAIRTATTVTQHQSTVQTVIPRTGYNPIVTALAHTIALTIQYLIIAYALAHAIVVN